jgi:hypothetical protein
MREKIERLCISVAISQQKAINWAYNLDKRYEESQKQDIDRFKPIDI